LVDDFFFAGGVAVWACSNCPATNTAATVRGSGKRFIKILDSKSSHLEGRKKESDLRV
jgi:hypothetical protein